MKYFISFLCILFAFDHAFSAECPTRNARGELCIAATPSVETDGDWITHKEALTNSCDCSCNANFTDTEGVRRGDIVAPHGKGEVICLNVRGKGCRGFQRDFELTCQRDGDDGSNSRRQGNLGDPKSGQNGSNENTSGRKFTKDQCRDDACGNADFGVTGMSWRQKDAAKAVCDQQYLQCLQDGQAKPDPQEALRIARSQVPDEDPAPEQLQPQPAPPPVAAQPAYQSQRYGPMLDCFWDPIFLSKGGVAMCLGPSSMRAELPGCYTPDIVNGQQAYICQGANNGPEMFYSRKSEYGGGRSW
jgi:hypothetical protein